MKRVLGNDDDEGKNPVQPVKITSFLSFVLYFLFFTRYLSISFSSRILFFYHSLIITIIQLQRMMNKRNRIQVPSTIHSNQIHQL